MTRRAQFIVLTYRILSGRERCCWRINPKRPTWRCKMRAEFLLIEEGTNNGWRVCEQHRAASICPPAIP